MQPGRLERAFLQFAGPSVGFYYETYLTCRDAAYRLKAAIQGRSLIVRTVGEPNSERVALVTSQGNVPRSIYNLLQLLRDQNCAVLFVVNGRLKPQTAARIEPLVWRIIERPNFGRDFGAYQAGILHLMSENIVPERLLVANDSMFYDINRSPGMLSAALDSKAPITAATENHDPVYHIGSFFFSVSKEVINSKAWKKYWRRYVPSSSRPHVIRYGELGMSIALIKRGGFQPHVLYNASSLGPALRRWTVVDLAQRVHRLPKEFREDIRSAGLDQIYRSDAILSADLVQIATNADPGEAMDRLQSVSSRAVRSLPVGRLVDQLLEKIESRSQVHWGGALMVEYLGLGFMKKDFSFRGLYNINDLIQTMAELDYPDLVEVREEISKRGLPISLKGVQRILYSLGYV